MKSVDKKLSKFSKRQMESAYIFRYSDGGSFRKEDFIKGIEKLANNEYYAHSTYFEEERAYIDLLLKKDYSLPVEINQIFERFPHGKDTKLLLELQRLMIDFSKIHRNKIEWMNPTWNTDLEEKEAIDLILGECVIQIQDGLFIATNKNLPIEKNKTQHIKGIIPAHLFQSLYLGDVFNRRTTEVYQINTIEYAAYQKEKLKERMKSFE